MEGGITYEVIEIFVWDPILLIIIFKANKNKNESKRWALYLKTKPVNYFLWVELSEISIKFHIPKSCWVDIWLWMYACDLNIHIGPNSK